MSNETRPERLTVSDLKMSNFDQTIDKGLATELKKGEKYAKYIAWNFFGIVWYNKEKEKYSCEIWQYNIHVKTLHFKSLKAIMKEASETYGEG